MSLRVLYRYLTIMPIMLLAFIGSTTIPSRKFTATNSK